MDVAPWILTVALLGGSALPQTPSEKGKPLLDRALLTAKDHERYVRVHTTCPGLWGALDYGWAPRAVSVRWFCTYADDEAGMVWNSFRVDFWPTDVCGFGDDGLLVTGWESSSHRTVIEKWDLHVPDALPAPSVAPGTGEVVHPDPAIAVGEKTQVYADASRGPIRVLLAKHGGGNEVLLHFWDDGTVRIYDLDTGELELLFAPTPGQEVPAKPELAGLHGQRWAGKHRVEGYVYCLGETDDERTFLMFDHDLDGDMDEAGLVRKEDFFRRSLDDGTLYDDSY
jgi:hypothetical protein